MKHFFEYLLFKFFRAVILLLPLKSVQQLGVMLSKIAYLLLYKRRNITLENLRYAFPEKSQEEITQIAKNVFKNLGIALCEFLWFPKMTPEIMHNLVTHKNPNVISDCYRAGKGLIMLTGHLGNWELNAFSSAYFLQIPIIIIVKTQKNILVDNIINLHRTIYGNKVVPMELAVREVLSTLNKGGIVGMIADQSAPKESVFVEFFGRKVATYQGPAILALRSKAPLQMSFIIRKPDYTYDIFVEEINTADLTEYNEANILELTQRHTALLEKFIRKYPDHWMWTHRRWKNIK